MHNEKRESKTKIIICLIRFHYSLKMCSNLSFYFPSQHALKLLFIFLNQSNHLIIDPTCFYDIVLNIIFYL